MSNRFPFDALYRAGGKVREPLRERLAPMYVERAESTSDPICRKCGGEGGEPMKEGPRHVWHPCYACY